MPVYRLNVDGAYTDLFGADTDKEARERALHAVAVEVERRRSSAISVTRDPKFSVGDIGDQVALILVYVPPSKKPPVSELAIGCLKKVHAYWYDSERASDGEPDLMYALNRLEDWASYEHVPDYDVCRDELERLVKLVGGLTEIVYVTGPIEYPRVTTGL